MLLTPRNWTMPSDVTWFGSWAVIICACRQCATYDQELNLIQVIAMSFKCILRHSSVSVVTRLCAERPRNCTRFPTGVQDSCSLQSVVIDSGAYPVLYSVCNLVTSQSTWFRVSTAIRTSNPKTNVMLRLLNGRNAVNTEMERTNKQTVRDIKESLLKCLFSVHIILFRTLIPGISHERNIKSNRRQNINGVRLRWCHALSCLINKMLG
jgi:hypothetical protein